MPYTLGIYTLGCKVNQYESEAIAETAQTVGFVLQAPTLPCDVYVINTCTVTAESDRKSRQFIRRVLSENPEAKVIVTGCLSQVAADSVAAIAGVDFICGSRDKLKVIDAALKLVGKPKESTPIISVGNVDNCEFEAMKISHFPRTRAYIKIEDGCESHCTYCIIPKARGRICSKPKQDILTELEALADAGCREVVLTGIETASYGIDLDNYRLPDLLKEVEEIAKGCMRVRLGSLDPSLIRPKFVEKIAPLTSLAPHFHLSMQSGCDRTLARMKRKYNTATALAGIELLRSSIGNVQFTTDIIAGFPGETDEDFAQTVAFMDKVGFLNAHIFTYSRRIGTPAANMPDQVPRDIAKSRTNELIARQKETTASILATERGKTYSVLFETDANGFSVGHTPSFIEVRVRSDRPIHSELHDVKLGDAEDGIVNGTLINRKEIENE